MLQRGEGGCELTTSVPSTHSKKDSKAFHYYRALSMNAHPPQTTIKSAPAKHHAQYIQPPSPSSEKESTGETVEYIIPDRLSTKHSR